MTNTWFIRFLTSLGLLAIAGYLLAPSVIYFTLGDAAKAEVKADSAAFAKHVPSWMGTKHIVPGLDLQGGVNMVLGVDLEKAISDKARRIASRMRDELTDKKIEFTSVDHLADQGTGDRLKVVFKDAAARTTFEKDLLENYGDLAEVSSSSTDIVFRVHPDWVNKIKTDAVDQTIKTISNRIDKMHVTEPSISKRGSDQIQIQLPGYTNPEEAKSLIGRTAQLEFQMLDDDTDFLTKLADLPSWAKVERSGFQRPDASYAQDIYIEFPEANLKDLRQYLIGKVPTGLAVKYGKENRRAGDQPMMRTYTIKDEVSLTGDDLVDARVSLGSPEDPRPAVSIEFSQSGKQLFGELTTKNVGQRMAIVLEDLVDSAPVINEPITGGTASISMGGNRAREESIGDANQLALVLKAGALPAPVEFREQRSVGPSLGADAVKGATRACLAGMAFVIVFMCFYYRLGGFFSILGVLTNLAYILAIMSWLGSTISLPGIAGLLLSVGMAVDANIIINERIREELRAGKTAKAAVERGYAHAFTAILDGHVTNIIAGLVLLQYGSGPVQNFATTMLIGTVCSLFTAVWITRIFFDAYVSRNPETIPT